MISQHLAWHRSSTHESHHLIIDGEAACRTARIERWGSWLLVKADEMDASKQCTRCKHVAARAVPAPLAAAPAPAFDAAAFFRELGRRGGSKRTEAKSLAARRREEAKRRTASGGLCAPVSQAPAAP